MAKQPLAVVLISSLILLHEFALALERRSMRALRGAYRAANICSGCDASIERCGPRLWERGKMCCPDCSHVNPVKVHHA